MQNNWLIILIAVTLIDLSLTQLTGLGLFKRIYIYYIIAKVFIIALLLLVCLKVVKRLNDSLEQYLK